MLLGKVSSLLTDTQDIPRTLLLPLQCPDRPQPSSDFQEALSGQCCHPEDGRAQRPGGPGLKVHRDVMGMTQNNLEPHKRDKLVTTSGSDEFTQPVPNIQRLQGKSEEIFG